MLAVGFKSSVAYKGKNVINNRLCYSYLLGGKQACWRTYGKYRAVFAVVKVCACGGYRNGGVSAAVGLAKGKPALGSGNLPVGIGGYG